MWVIIASLVQSAQAHSLSIVNIRSTKEIRANMEIPVLQAHDVTPSLASVNHETSRLFVWSLKNHEVWRSQESSDTHDASYQALA